MGLDTAQDTALDPARRPDASPWPARILAAVVALLITGPALAPGFVLLRDMVFVPRQDLDLDALGLGGTLPRAVPIDAATALVTAVVPGDLLQKAVLLLAVFAAVLGAARLVPPGPDGRRGAAAVVAGLVYGWSPYLGERLLLGHWTLLLAYAALPWIARAGLRLRAGEPRAGARLLLACAPAALSPTGAVLAAGVVLAVVGGRRAVAALGGLLVLALPWILAGALHPAGGLSDPGGVAAFAARGENWGGPLVALLGTGGVWNAGAALPSRTSVLVPVVTAALVALAAYGWHGARPLGRPARGLLVLGVAGLVLAAAGSLPGGRQLLEFLVAELPGAGLLRDGQKWVAWWALPLAVGAGLGLRRLAARVRRFGRAPAAAVTAAVVLVPLVTLPDLAWGAAGRLEPVRYPAAWQQVRDRLAAGGGPGDVLVLPFGAYRAFSWNDERPSLDPAPRWLPVPAVVDDELVVGGTPVAGEDRRAREVAAAVADPARLAELGIGWVLVEERTAGRPVPAAVRALPEEISGPELTLYRVPDARSGPAPSTGRVIAVGGAHVVALGLVGAAVLWIIAGASTVPLRRRTPKKVGT